MHAWIRSRVPEALEGFQFQCILLPCTVNLRLYLHAAQRRLRVSDQAEQAGESIRDGSDSPRNQSE